MNDRISIKDLDSLISNSAFNRSGYVVSVRMSGFFKNLSMYTHGYTDTCVLEENPEKIFDRTPPFQRDNDKWTKDMQEAFIKNLIKGLKSTIVLYEVLPVDGMALRCECMILDGLQRLTALYEFIHGDLTVFGYTHKELLENKVYRLAIQTINIQVHSFSSEIEAVEFYIEINENISHSKEDIMRAKSYLTQLKSEQKCYENEG